MSNGLKSIEKNMALRDRAKSLTTDVGQLKKDLDGVQTVIQNIVSGINSTLGSHPKRLKTIEEIIGAVIDVAGLDMTKVQEKVEEKRQELAKKDYEEGQLAMDKAVETGNMVLADQIDEACLVSGVEKSKDGHPVSADGAGEAVYQGHVNFEASKLDQTAFEQLKGKRVGDVVNVPNDGTFLIERILKPNPEKVQEAVQKAMDRARQVEETSQEQA